MVVRYFLTLVGLLDVLDHALYPCHALVGAMCTTLAFFVAPISGN
jgi:hypothetical protein